MEWHDDGSVGHGDSVEDNPFPIIVMKISISYKSYKKSLPSAKYLFSRCLLNCMHIRCDNRCF